MRYLIYSRPETRDHWWVVVDAKDQADDDGGDLDMIGHATSLEGARALLPPGLSLVWSAEQHYTAEKFGEEAQALAFHRVTREQWS